MVDVTIHRCVLRVVRQGGWSWGADPQGLAREAVDVMAGLLARHLAEAWPEGAEGVLTDPLRIVIRLAAHELAGAREDPLDEARASAVHSRFREAIHAAVQAAPIREAIESADPSEGAGTGRPFAANEDPDEADPIAALWRLFVAWQRRGELESALGRLADEAVATCHDALFAAAREAIDREGATREPAAERSIGGAIRSALPVSLDLDALLRSIVPMAAQRPEPPIARARARIVAVAAALAELGLDRATPVVLAAVDCAIPWSGSVAASRLPAGPSGPPALEAPPGTVVAGAKFVPPAGTATTDQPLVSRGARRSRPTRAQGGQAHCALPFLMLGPLERMGYIEALGGLLAAAGLAQEAPLFATALAHKSFAPPERGWRRSVAEAATAALFAGLEEPAPGPALARFARRLAPFLPALDHVILDALVRGHQATRPLLLTRAGDGWLLAESDGVFPVAWVPGTEGVGEVLRRFGDSPLLVPADCAEVDLLERLDILGVGFVTDAPPTRGETWRSLRRREGRWWTNIKISDGACASEGVLVAATRGLGPSSQALAACWTELAERRPCVVPQEDEALERSLTLAAAVAMAEMAWTLWRTTGAGGGTGTGTDPLLTLERFGDLDARVRFDPGQVRVALPLGKRSLDLARHHLLDDVAGVPWFGGRVVRFSGGFG
jgi:hypothetical protein